MSYNDGNKINNINLNNKKVIDDFVIHINKISDTIKEYFELSNNLSKNKRIHINSLEKEINSSILDKVKLLKIINLLKQDISSEDGNLSLFYENIQNISKDIQKKENENKKDISRLKELNLKYESKLSKMSRTNPNLSLLLDKQKKEIDNLKNKNSEKLKSSIRTGTGNSKDELLESIKSILEEKENNSKPWRNFNNSINRIMENYRIENEELKNKLKDFEDKQKDFENKQNDFENKIKEIKNEKIKAENNLKLLKKYLDKSEEDNKKLKDEIADRDHKIINMEIEIEKNKEEKEQLNNIMISNRISENNNDNERNEKNNNLQKILKKEREEKNILKEELEKLKLENEKFKNKLLSKGINCLGGEEIYESKNTIIENYKDKVEYLLQENKTLKDKIEALSSQFLNPQENINLIIKEKNELQKKLIDLENKCKKEKEKNIFNSINSISINNINNIGDLIKLKEENEKLKKENSSLILEVNEIKKSIILNKSENDNFQYYQEEFDKKAMANFIWRKNKSLDMNIDYPGYQKIKEQYRELLSNYRSLRDLVKNLLNNIQVNLQNITYVNKLCKILGFDSETTSKIMNNSPIN